jgi:hypothetical protein
MKVQLPTLDVTGLESSRLPTVVTHRGAPPHARQVRDIRDIRDIIVNANVFNVPVGDGRRAVRNVRDAIHEANSLICNACRACRACRAFLAYGGQVARPGVLKSLPGGIPSVCRCWCERLWI